MSGSSRSHSNGIKQSDLFLPDLATEAQPAKKEEGSVCQQVTVELGEDSFVLIGEGPGSFSVPVEYKGLFRLFNKKIFAGAPGEILTWREVDLALGGRGERNIATASMRGRISKLNLNMGKALGTPPKGKQWICAAKRKGCQLNESAEWDLGQRLRKEMRWTEKDMTLIDPHKMQRNTPNRDEKLPALPVRPATACAHQSDEDS